MKLFARRTFSARHQFAFGSSTANCSGGSRFALGALGSSLALGSALLICLGCNSNAAPEPGTTSETAKKASTAKPTAEHKAATGTVSKTMGGTTDPTLAERQAKIEALIAARSSKTQAAHSAGSPRPATPQKATDDPTGGNFTLSQALEGLAGTGEKVSAKIETDLGTLSCELWPEKAPNTVANFVGLARGSRPWKSGGKWVKKPLYDGTTFHRIIKDFMIQGGDPNGNGSGGPGYVIPDEIWTGAHHDQRGQICMANRGPNTNGSQFFIMDGPAKHLDGGYTIFGKCGPESLVEKLASTPMKGRKPVKAPLIKKVTIQRG